MEPRTQLQICLDLISRDPVIFGSKKFFVAAEGAEEKTENQLNFPLPKDADIAGFLAGNSGSDGRAYKRGVLALVNELKEWIKNNKAGSEGELDTFLRRYGKYDGTNKEENGIMLPLLQEGIPLLKKIANYLVQYPLEISRSGKPQPKDMKKNKVYLYAEEGKLFFKAKQSKESIEIKPEDLDEDLYENILGVLNDPVANLNEKQEHALYKITAQHGFPPPPDERKLERQKAVIKNLVESLYVCAPGCHTNIFDAYLALSSNPYEVMMEYRKNIIQQYLIEAIEPYTKQFKENGDKVIDPGMILHYANTIMKKYEHPLGLKVINDTFGHFCNPAVLIQVEKDVFNRLLIQEGEKNPNGTALNQAAQGISHEDREKLTAELFKAQFTMDKVLEFAMRRCDLDFLDKKLAKSPCEITVMDEFPTKTETDWQVKYKGRHILLKANGTDRRNPVLYWIEYANRPVEKAIKFKDQDGFHQEIEEYLKDNPKTLRLSAEQAENLLTKYGGGVVEVQASVAQHAIDDFKADLNLYGADSVPFEMDKLYEIDVIEVDVVNQEKPTSQARYLPKPDAKDNLQVSMLERLERLDFLQLAGVKLGPEQTDELQLYTFKGKDVHYAYVEEQISNTRFRSSLIDYIWEKIAEEEEGESEEAEQAMSKLKPEQQIELLQGLQEYIAILAKQQKWNPQGLEDLAKKVKLILSNDNINALLTGNRTIGINILANLPEEYYPRLWPLVTGEEWLLKAESKGPFVLFETLNKYEPDNKEKILKLIENLAPESRAKVIKYLSEAKGELESKFFKNILGRSFPALYEAFFKSMDAKTQNESLLAMWGHFLTKDPSTKFHLEPEDKSIFFRLIEISSSEVINEFLEKEQEGGSLLSQIFKFMNFDTVYFDKLLSKTSYANIVDAFFSKEETFKPRDDLIRLLTLPRTMRGVQPESESKEESAKEEKSRTLNFILQLVYKLPQDLRNFSHYQELLASVGLSLDDIKLNLPQAEINSYLASVLALVEPHKRLTTLLDLRVEIKDLDELVLFGKNLNVNDLDAYLLAYPVNSLFRDDQRWSPSVANKLDPDNPFKAMKTKPQEVPILLAIVLQSQGKKLESNELISDPNLKILELLLEQGQTSYGVLDRNLPAFQAYVYQMLSLASPGVSMDVFMNSLSMKYIPILGSKNMEILLTKADKEVIRAKSPFVYLGLSSQCNQLIKDAHGSENYKKLWEERYLGSPFIHQIKPGDEGKNPGNIIRLVPSDLCLEILQVFKTKKISWFSIFSQCTEKEFSDLIDSVGPEWVKSLLNLDGNPNFFHFEMKVNENDLELSKKNIDTLIEKVTPPELAKLANGLINAKLEGISSFKMDVIKKIVKKIQSENPTALHELPAEKFTELLRNWLNASEDLCKYLTDFLDPNQVQEFIRNQYLIQFCLKIHDPKGRQYLKNMLSLADHKLQIELLSAQARLPVNPFHAFANQALDILTYQDAEADDFLDSCLRYIDQCTDLISSGNSKISLSETATIISFNHTTPITKIMVEENYRRKNLIDYCSEKILSGDTNFLSILSTNQKDELFKSIHESLAKGAFHLTLRQGFVRAFYHNNEIQILLRHGEGSKELRIKKALEDLVRYDFSAAAIDEILPWILEEGRFKQLKLKGQSAILECMLQDNNLTDAASMLNSLAAKDRGNLLVNFRNVGGKTFEGLLSILFKDEKVIPDSDQFQEFINNKFATLFASKISDPGSKSYLQNLLVLADETFLRDFLTMQASLPANPFYSLARASLERLSNSEAGQSNSAEIAMIFIEDCSKCIESIDLKPDIYPLSASENFSVFDWGDISIMKVEQTIDGQKQEKSFTDYCWEKMSEANTNLFSILSRQQKVDVLERLLIKIQQHPFAQSTDPEDREKYVQQLKTFFSNNEIQTVINFSRYPSFDEYGDKTNLGKLDRLAYGLGFINACPEEAKDEILALYIPESKNKGRLALLEYALQGPDNDDVAETIVNSLPIDLRMNAIEELSKSERGSLILQRARVIEGTINMIQDLVKEIKDEPNRWEELSTKISKFLSIEEVKKLMNDAYYLPIFLQMLASLPEAYCTKLLPLIAGEEWLKGGESQGYLALFEYGFQQAPDKASSTLSLLKVLSPDSRTRLLRSLSQAKGGVEQKFVEWVCMIASAFRCGISDDAMIGEEIVKTLFGDSDTKTKDESLVEVWKFFLTKKENKYKFEDEGYKENTDVFCKLLEIFPRELLNEFLNTEVGTPSLLTRIYSIIFPHVSLYFGNPEGYFEDFLAKLDLQTIKNSFFTTEDKLKAKPELVEMLDNVFSKIFEGVRAQKELIRFSKYMFMLNLVPKFPPEQRNLNFYQSLLSSIGLSPCDFKVDFQHCKPNLPSFLIKYLPLEDPKLRFSVYNESKPYINNPLDLVAIGKALDVNDLGKYVKSVSVYAIYGSQAWAGNRREPFDENTLFEAMTNHPEEVPIMYALAVRELEDCKLWDVGEIAISDPKLRLVAALLEDYKRLPGDPREHLSTFRDYINQILISSSRLAINEFIDVIFKSYDACSNLGPKNMGFLYKMAEEEQEAKLQAIETETPNNVDHAAESLEKLLHDLHTLVMPKQTSTMFAHNVSSLRGDLGGVVHHLEVACNVQDWTYARDSVQRLDEYEKNKRNDSLRKLVEKLQAAIAIEISKAPTVAPKAPEVPKEPRARGGGHGNIAGG